jgi:hypothetical protein
VLCAEAVDVLGEGGVFPKLPEEACFLDGGVGAQLR